MDEEEILAEDKVIEWELIDPTGRVIASTEQTLEDYEVKGVRDALDDLLPLDHINSANRGEWDMDEFVYEHKGKKYRVRYKVAPERDPIPEPLSLGCGVLIDMISDHFENPVWYVGIYRGGKFCCGGTEWIGEVPVRKSPKCMSLEKVEETAELVAWYILRLYPECPEDRDELARRIRMVLRTARGGYPMPYPAIMQDLAETLESYRDDEDEDEEEEEE